MPPVTGQQVTLTDSNGASAALEALLASADDRLTFMCTPWGSGIRIAIDRDLDGVLNGDEM